MTLPRGFFARPFAHRGLHDRTVGRIENSRAAVKAAVDTGYGIEVDVQLTRDGQAVVFHDDHLGRLTGQDGAPRDFDLAELTRIRLRDSDETIPPLVEILTLVGDTPLLVEIKDQTGQMGPTDRRLETAVARALAGHCGPVAVMSFNPHCMAAMRTLAPAIPRGLVTCAFGPDWDLPAPRRDALRAIPDYAPVGACFISHEHDNLNAKPVQNLRSHGALINCWTIRDPASEARARKLADTITFEGYRPALS